MDGSPFYVEYDGEGFILTTGQVMIILRYYLGLLFPFLENRLVNCVMKYISEQIIMPHNYLEQVGFLKTTPLHNDTVTLHSHTYNNM